MSADDFAELGATGRIPATGETFISTSRQYAARYNGVTVQFNTRPGTMTALQQIGVRHRATSALTQMFPRMPVAARGWWRTSAMFKIESGTLNIGLGRGTALDTFNQRITSFGAVPK